MIYKLGINLQNGLIHESGMSADEINKLNKKNSPKIYNNGHNNSSLILKLNIHIGTFQLNMIFRQKINNYLTS